MYCYILYIILKNLGKQVLCIFTSSLYVNAELIQKSSWLHDLHHVKIFGLYLQLAFVQNSTIIAALNFKATFIETL